MTGGFPRRPSGNTPEAIFQQWVWDTLRQLRMNETPDAMTSRTTKGFQVIPKRKGGGSGTTGGWRYRGDFVDNTSYKVNDVIRSRSGNYALGVFICVFANPVLTSTGKCIGPTYPEPFDVNGAQNYWELLALGVKLYASCKNGASTTTYINLNEV